LEELQQITSWADWAEAYNMQHWQLCQ